MNIPKGYKQTELGIIPEDWEVVTIDDVLSMPTKTISTSSFDHKFYIGTENMLSAKRGVSPYSGTFPYLQVREYLTYDILTSNIRPYLKKIWLADKCGGCSSDVIVFRVKDTNIICPTYIYTIISDDNFFRYSMDSAIGTKMPRGDKSAIKTYSFAIPQSLSEQKAIAKALSDVDGLIAALDKKIAKKRLVKQGAMQQLLTGKKRLPGFTEEWVDRKLCNFGFMVRGVSYKPEQSSLSPKEGYSSLLRSSNVQGDSIVYSDYVYVDNNYVSEKQKIVKNDILICIANGSKQLVGKSALIEKEGDFTFGAFMGVFRCEDQNIAPFVVSLMHSECYKKQIEDILTGSAINNLNASTIESMLFFVPASTEEQLAIASILSDMDKEIVELETRRDKYRLLKSGMMQKLLTGQVRLNK